MIFIGLGLCMVILAHDSNIMNWVKITHGLTGMGNAVPYPYPLYPLGKDFFPLSYPWVKNIAIPLP
jgi:hypothetical protein